ncbi:MAG: (d)CMP kinase [Actinomycetota bacterium]|nr:(d)CMP kinase [Actinomycetota bacterium]
MPFAGVVAMDGPSGTGKSTVSRQLALRLSVRYLDTGAMYRAATLAVLRAGISVSDTTEVIDEVLLAQIELSTDPRSPAVMLGGEPVDTQIRSAQVTAAVSDVAAIAEVRQLLVLAQRVLIGTGSIVVEGRDIGSVVWPHARPKIYLTASAQVRAQRRAAEMGDDVDARAVAQDIERRDRIDSTRQASPLAQVESAIVVDTTELDVDQVVNRLVDITLGTHSNA